MKNPELGRTIHNVTVIKGGTQVNSIPGQASLAREYPFNSRIQQRPSHCIITKIVDELNKKKKTSVRIND